jgi:hypothetical protein
MRSLKKNVTKLAGNVRWRWVPLSTSFVVVDFQHPVDRLTREPGVRYIKIGIGWWVVWGGCPLCLGKFNCRCKWARASDRHRRQLQHGRHRSFFSQGKKSGKWCPVSSAGADADTLCALLLWGALLFLHFCIQMLLV